MGHVKAQTYYSHRREDAHFCHRHVGYGVQESLLRELDRQGVHDVVLTVQPVHGGLQAYRTPLLLWRVAGTLDDLGDGPQRFLSARQLVRATADPKWAGDLIHRIKVLKKVESNQP